MQADVLAVDVEIGGLSYSLELDEYFLPFATGRQPEVFAIPYDGVCQFVDAVPECFVFIEGMGKGDLFPVAVGKLLLFGSGGIAYRKQPVRIEIVLLPHFGV